MILPAVPRLTLQGVFDPGVPNKERVVFYASEPVDLSAFGVLVGLALANGATVPVWDNLYWFGEFVIPKDCFLILFSGSGKPHRIDRDPQILKPVYFFYWGRPQVMFSSSNFVPMLFEMSALSVGSNSGAPVQQKPPEPLKLPTLGALADEPTERKPGSLAGSLSDLLRVRPNVLDTIKRRSYDDDKSE